MFHALQQVDSAAAVFPEMLHSLIIVNAPGFFSFFWSMIRGLVDAKTASLIEIYSSPEKGKQRLLELINERELPRDYGGQAPSTAEIILREGRKEGSVPHRQIVQLLHVGSNEKRFSFGLEAHERAEFCIYTRSTAKYNFSLLEGPEGRVVHKQEINVQPPAKVPMRHDFGNNDSSSSSPLSLVGPKQFTMVVHPTNRNVVGKHYFLAIGEVFQV